MGHSQIAASVCGFLLVCAALGDTVTLTATRDNTLYEQPGGGLSNGAGQYVFAGTTVTSQRRRALLRFDVSGAIPAGSTVGGPRRHRATRPGNTASSPRSFGPRPAAIST
jgi:hypothetical protein